jgi:hypothetical protein
LNERLDNEKGGVENRLVFTSSAVGWRHIQKDIKQNMQNQSNITNGWKRTKINIKM